MNDLAGESAFTALVRAASRPIAGGVAVELAASGVALEVHHNGGLRVRVCAAREGDGVARGEELVAASLPGGDEAGCSGLAVFYNGQLAARSEGVRSEGEPDPEALASARAFVSSLAQCALAPDAGAFVTALAALGDGPDARAHGEALVAALFGRAR